MFGKIEGKNLIVNGLSYVIRYATEKNLVLNTSDLFGKYGDEFPLHLIRK